MQIRFFTFKNVASLQNLESVEVSSIKHELNMWESTERSISTISKFDDISRSVIHSRVMLLNEALQREMESIHQRSDDERTVPKSLSFYLAEKKALESHTNSESNVVNPDDGGHEQLSRRLKEMVEFLFYSKASQCLI